jgi:DNA-binding IclR family transcriptional regulator
MLDLTAAMVRLGPASLTELAAASGCTRVNAFRLLHTLQTRGLALQSERRGHWELGTGWLPIALAATRDGAMQSAAHPIMAELARLHGEPVYLALREGEQCVVAAVQGGTATLRLIALVGDRWPLHAGPGRLLLAYAPLTVQRAVLAGRLPRLARATQTDPARVSADLPGIQQRRWLITTNELADGMVSISAAVPGPPGEFVAALSIMSPALRLRPPRPHTLLTPLLEAAAQLGRVLFPTITRPAPETGPSGFTTP